MAKKHRADVTAPSPSKKSGGRPNADRRKRAEMFLSRYSLAIFLALTALGSVRIVSTYWVFNHTIDEPAHIACGMEWLDQHVYRYEPQHPPLARVMTALLPYMTGEHYCGKKGIYNEGAAILYARGHYDRVLALARLGILPFFWLGCWIVYLWTRRSFGEPAAFFATLSFTFLPPILAHAGLATTDMALTATFGAAFLAMLLWVERPSRSRTRLVRRRARIVDPVEVLRARIFPFRGVGGADLLFLRGTAQRRACHETGARANPAVGDRGAGLGDPDLGRLSILVQ